MTKPFLLLCFFALSNSVMGQGSFYVYSNGECQAFDAYNTDCVMISEDSVCFGAEETIRKSYVDSITFTNPNSEFIRTGWWGDVCGGYSTYNHQRNDEELPIMEMTAVDSICQTAYYYLSPQNYSLSRAPYKVGRKWRYVRNTLTGRRKLEFTLNDEQAISYYTTPGWGREGTYSRLDLSGLITGKPANDVKRMVSYWHHPSAFALSPVGTVVGHCEINDRSKVSSYHTTTFQDSVRCEILFWACDDEVNCDTMHLYFRSKEEAQMQFQQMDTTNDEFTMFAQWDNQIIIVEFFQATVEEVRRWLTRFDFEMAQPIIIRKE